MAKLNLTNRIREFAYKAPRQLAYVEADGKKLTYYQLSKNIELTAKYLVSFFYEYSEDSKRITLCCNNQIHFAIWFLAALESGAQVLVLPADGLQSEVVALSKQAGTKIIIADEINENIFCDKFDRFLPLNLCYQLDENNLEKIKLPKETGSVLLASSGTTAAPRLVRRTGESLDAMAEIGAEAIDIKQYDRVLGAVPLVHSYGLEHGLLIPLWAGASVLLCNGLDSWALITQLKRGAQIFPAVPAMIELLPKLVDAKKNSAKLKLIYSAGALLPQKAYDLFYETFGLNVGQVYGMSEIGSVTFNNPNINNFDSKSIGKPMRGVSLRLLNQDESGQGELAVYSKSMLQGYLNEQVEFVDKHFLTGDIAKQLNDGSYKITGRKSFLIDIGGRNVNPKEVEDVLLKHPEVDYCAIVQIEQSQATKRIRAVIVPENMDNCPTANDIRIFASKYLAKYKIPRLIEFCSTLPRLANGKIDYKSLKK